MSNTLTWKGLELSVYLQGVAGNKIFNANKIDLTGMSAAYNQLGTVLHVSVADAIVLIGVAVDGTRHRGACAFAMPA